MFGSFLISAMATTIFHQPRLNNEPQALRSFGSMTVSYRNQVLWTVLRRYIQYQPGHGYNNCIRCNCTDANNIILIANTPFFLGINRELESILSVVRGICLQPITNIIPIFKYCNFILGIWGRALGVRRGVLLPGGDYIWP